MLFGYKPKQFIERIIQEFITPQTSLGKKIKLLFIKKYQTKLKRNLNLNLLYNLDYNSATFDFGRIPRLKAASCKTSKIGIYNLYVKRMCEKDFDSYGYPLKMH